VAWVQKPDVFPVTHATVTRHWSKLGALTQAWPHLFFIWHQGFYLRKFICPFLCVNFVYANSYVRNAIHKTFLHTKSPKFVRKYTCVIVLNRPLHWIAAVELALDVRFYANILKKFSVNVHVFCARKIWFQNGFVSALPFLGLWAATVVFPLIADKLRSAGLMATITVRRVFNSIGKPLVLLLLQRSVRYHSENTEIQGGAENQAMAALSQKGAGYITW